MLQGLMLDKSHQYSDALVKQLDRPQGSDPGSVVPDPSRLAKEYGDSEYVEMVKDLNLKTSVDAITFFARHGASTPLKFVNCRQVENTGRDNRPYDLVIAPKNECKKGLYIVSSSGVVTVRPGEPTEHVSLSGWVRAAAAFNDLRGISFFRNYLAVKAVRAWRRTVEYRRFKSRRDRLQKKLLFSRDTFAKPMMLIQGVLAKVGSETLISLKKDPVALDDFDAAQQSLRTQLGRKVETAVMRCANMTDDLCRNSKAAEQKLVDAAEAKEDAYENLVIGASEKNKGMVAMREEAEAREAATRRARTIVGMLPRFVRLADTLVVEGLYRTLLIGRTDFLDGLCARKPMKELFLQSVVLSDGAKPGDKPQLQYTPDVETVRESLEDTWDQLCKVAHASPPRLLRIPSLRAHLRGSEIEMAPSLNVEQLLGSSYGWLRSGLRIQAKVDADFKALRADCEPSLLSFGPLYTKGKEWDEKAMIAKGGTVTTLGDAMKKQEHWLIDLEQIRIVHEGGNIYFCRTDSLKKQLRPIAERELNTMMGMMKKLYADCSHSLKTMYDAQQSVLEKRPENLGEFAVYVRELAEVRAKKDAMFTELKQVEKMSFILDHYKVVLLPEEKMLLNSMKKARKKFDKALDSADKFESSKIEGKKLEVKKSIGGINSDLKSVIEKLGAPPYTDAKAAPAAVVESLNALKVDLDAVVERALNTQEYQRSFKIPVVKFPLIAQSTELFERKSNIWTTYSDFVTKAQRWNTANFSEVDVIVLDQDVKEIFTVATKLNKSEKSHPVTKTFKAMVQGWKLEAPLLGELGSPAMKQKYWEQLWAKLEVKDRDPDEVLTINLIRDKYDMFKKKNLVSDVCGSAMGEYVLEQKVAKIAREWKDMEFETTSYRDSKKDFILGDIEPVTTLIEDHQVNLQSMLGSPFVAPMQKEVEKWDSDLSFLAYLLDDWLLCQRNWMYLEPIFAADDIRKAMQKEAAMFKEVDRFFRKFLREVRKNPNVLSIIADREIRDKFVIANKKLDKIQKELEDYLETKRAAFARFYFLSNEELIVILSQTRDPQAVQPHLLKCFDNIARLKFTEERNSNEVTHMQSMKKEVVKFVESVFTRGNPEVWLGEIEVQMQTTVRNSIKQALLDYPVGETNRNAWFEKWPAMAILMVDCIMWTFNCMKAIQDIQSGKDPKALQKFLAFSDAQILSMVDRVRGSLSKLQRRLMSQLLIIDVHAKEVVAGMVRDEVKSIGDFQWAKQMRYYWENEEDDAVEDDEDDAKDGGHKAAPARLLDRGAIQPGLAAGGEECIIRQTNARFKSSYEYQGSAGRLVITPLTDKCYLTLTGALHLHKGGAPAGPAGTGKTETVKDLAKSLAVKIVVFNCSEGLTASFMARFFSGLSQCGAFCCFDEFNRIDIEVLSVIAEQILTIQQAIVQGKETVQFAGRVIGVNPMFGVFVTMNPGYAGRTELPDNLKSLFRPVAMMIPDYALIAEIILFSEGFQDATNLAQKMVKLYRLSSEQLSKQDHYDFGMRAVKSVLVMAGSLKRTFKDQTEDVLLIRAMRDSNVPKFLDHDLPLFRMIISDLFPGVDPPPIDYGPLGRTIVSELKKKGLQADAQVQPFIDKVIQLHETMLVRHGVMVVGETMSGKTTLINALKNSLTTLGKIERKTKKKADRNPEFMKVKMVTVNPKSVKMQELYGFEHPITQEWTDGLIGKITRNFCEDTSECKKWCLFDGPVDTLWIESMNTVLDDNKALCLGNGEVIKIPNTMAMLFENDSLFWASPATVSRCGMVYIEQLHLGWKPLVNTWRSAIHKNNPAAAERTAKVVIELVEKVLPFVRENCAEKVPSVDKNLVLSFLGLLGTMLIPENGVDQYTDDEEITATINKYVYISLVWSFGSNLDDESQKKFDVFARKALMPLVQTFPVANTVYDYWIDDDGEFQPWSEMVPEYEFDIKMPFFNILVPTEDTTKFKRILEQLVTNNINCKFIGNTGVGKTSIIENYFQDAKTMESFVYVPVTFSAQTSSRNLQDVLESKLVSKRKTLMGAPLGKKVVVFIDDVNMPTKEIYSAQPPIELMRQCMDQKGFYDRQKLILKNIVDVLFVAACSPPGGGRSEITSRATRHFHLVWEPQLPKKSMTYIFSLIMRGYLGVVAPGLQELAGPLIESTVDIYDKICKQMLPTPTKSHYTFNLRDLSKVVQGMLMVFKKELTEEKYLLKLWLHESARVFRDRLINDEDRGWFDDQCASILPRFKVKWKKEEFNRVLFGDYTNLDVRQYKLVRENPAKLSKLFDEYLLEYNSTESNTMNLVFFEDAMMHLSRISRVLRQPRGNALLVGMGGSGRQSLTRFAAYMNEYQSRTIELKRGYGAVEWRDDLKAIMRAAGESDSPIVFIFSDTQVVYEFFLENINNILNSGEVPNLFEPEDLDQVAIAMKPKMEAKNMRYSRTEALKFFTQCVRENLHIVLTFSPVGEGFRSRCRQYPALVNCCTIDWFDAWPAEALYSVAERFFAEKTELKLGKMKKDLARVCVTIHQSVNEETKNFYRKLKRHNYTTPTSYLDLIKQYFTMFGKQKKLVQDNLRKYKGGLKKLRDTEVVVADLKKEIIRMQPILKKESEETAKLLVTLKEQQGEAKVQETACQKDARACKKVAIEVKKQKDSCQRDLDKALPAYNEAIAALDTLDKKDIGVMKGFPNPPEGVKKVMEMVCILFAKQPDVKNKTDWATSKKLLSKSAFIKMCQEYDKDHIPKSILKKLRPYTEDKDLTKENLEKVSKAAVSICLWAKAMYIYATVAKEIEPKRQRLAKAEAELKEVKDKLDIKMKALKEVQDRVKSLQQTYKAKIKQRDELKRKIAKAEARLVRAGKLTGGLSSEAKRWTQTAAKLEKDTVNLVGNILMGAGYISYLGPFTAPFRQLISRQWINSCIERKIPVDPDFDLINVLADPLEARNWKLQGLPADNYSTENGFITSSGGRWPLMIDPQGQANRWIKNFGAKQRMNVVKQNNPKYLNILQNAISIGNPVLLEDVGETLDAAIDPVLRKQVFKKQGQMVLRFMDQDVPYSKKFRFFITTKLPNPHYMPEVFIKTTIINFTVTPKGLEDQLLVEVCKIERADLEEKNDELVVQIASDQKKLADIENQILTMLSNAGDNILDNEKLINTLAQSKLTSEAVKERVSEAEGVVATINVTREKYRVVAKRASILYFIIADLALVDPMYQYSLVYFKEQYRMRINKSERPEDANDLQKRLEILLADITINIYKNICRGLFEKDKGLFSFLIAVQINKAKGDLTDGEFAFLMRSEEAKDAPPAPEGIPVPTWRRLVSFESQILKSPGAMTKDSNVVKAFAAIVDDDRPDQQPLPAPWDTKLTEFQKLLLYKVLRADVLIRLTQQYVIRTRGKEFTESPPFSLKSVYDDSNQRTPIVFVLSPGADPMSYLLRLARDQGVDENQFRYISLGQGQGPKAQRLMKQARESGGWVCLQNCHLSVSWLPELEQILTAAAKEDVHEDYRLWLTSLPTPKFPVSILQQSIKVTNEPPRGLKANISLSFSDLEDSMFGGSSKPAVYKNLLFGLAFFHAVCQERRKFGAIGWNIPYEWMGSDLNVSISQLRMFLDENDEVPWETLRYVIGEVNYGGRITDDKDIRLAARLLFLAMNQGCLRQGYKYSPSGAYFPPEAKEGKELTKQDVLDYVASLPALDNPEVFGLHANANITYQLKESKSLLDSIITVSPTVAAGGDGEGKAKTPQQVVTEMADEFERRLPALLTRKGAHPSTFKGMSTGGNTLAVFLSQEMIKFNRLLKVIKSSLKNLKEAIKGLQVMSADLEKIFNCFLLDRVPKAWALYPCLKPLGSWFKDMVHRLEFMGSWLKNGPPAAFWLSGFFFPQGFMTSVLQRYARRTKIPIDTLRFRTEPMCNKDVKAITKAPAKGAYCYGLYLQGAGWDTKNARLRESDRNVLFDPMPPIWLDPVTQKEWTQADAYECPTYKTSRRAGTLTTTGHSSNFVLFMYLDTAKDPGHWIRRGVAMLCMLDT